MNIRDLEKLILTSLHNSQFIDRHRKSPKDFTRQSYLSFSKVVALVFQKMTKSLQVEANLLGDLLGKEPVSKQALSAARYKFKASAFQELHQTCLKEVYTDSDDFLWKGFRVFGGDGSTLQLPKQGDIPKVYGEQFKRTSLARVFQYVELTSDLVVKADLKPYSTSEESMAKRALPELVEQFRSYGQERQIYVYDRGFPSHAFTQEHVNLNVDFLFRVQRTYSRKILSIVEEGEEADFEMSVRRKNIDYQARVIIRYLSSGEPLVLVTSLMNRSSYSIEDLVELYKMRWRSEESYKFQKILLHMDCNYCRSAEGVEQDFWATVLLSLTMGMRFNQFEYENPCDDRNRKIKVNKSVVFASLKTFYLRVLMGKALLSEFKERFHRLCKKNCYKWRPNRSYPRLSVDTRKTRHCHRRHA